MTNMDGETIHSFPLQIDTPKAISVHPNMQQIFVVGSNKNSEGSQTVWIRLDLGMRLKKPFDDRKIDVRNFLLKEFYDGSLGLYKNMYWPKSYVDTIEHIDPVHSITLFHFMAMNSD